MKIKISKGTLFIILCAAALVLLAILGPRIHSNMYWPERDPDDKGVKSQTNWSEQDKILHPAQKFAKDLYSMIAYNGTFEATPDDSQIYTDFPMSKNFGEDVWYEVKGRLLKDLGVYLARDVALNKTILVEDSMYRQIKKDGASLAGIGLPEAGTYIRVRHMTVDFGASDKRSSPMISNFYESEGQKYKDIVKAVESGGNAEYPLTKEKARIVR